MADGVKGPHTTFDAGIKVKAMLELELEKQPDGRWKYRPSKVDGSIQTDETIAKEAGATRSWVSDHRKKHYLGGFITQKAPRQSKPTPFVYPNATAPEVDEVRDLRSRLSLLSSEFDLYKDEQEVKYRALWNLIDQRTAPPTTSHSQLFNKQMAEAV